jgi:hypothetical protein
MLNNKLCDAYYHAVFSSLLLLALIYFEVHVSFFYY